MARAWFFLVLLNSSSFSATRQEDSLATPNTLTNLCRNGGNNAGKKKLTVTEADRSMNVFIEEGYLQKVGTGKRQRIGLGARFLAEMEGWLADDERPEGVWKR